MAETKKKMKLLDYLMMFKHDPDFDCPDTEIDDVVTVCFDKENITDIMNGKLDKEFPYYDKVMLAFYKKVDVDYLLNDGSPVIDVSGLVKRNKDKFMAFAEKNFYPQYWEAVKDDEVELCYQFIQSFHAVLGGNYGETNNRKYYNLLRSCK